MPEGEADIRVAPRTVHIGWHPVGGVAGKWFAEQTKLGKLITEKIDRYPDPTQHWAVLVGDYAHELWMVQSYQVQWRIKYCALSVDSRTNIST